GTSARALSCATERGFPGPGRPRPRRSGPSGLRWFRRRRASRSQSRWRSRRCVLGAQRPVRCPRRSCLTARRWMFVWARPLWRREVEELGDEAQEGPVLGARVEHELAKRVLIGDDPRVFFTTSHFKGYPAVLGRLDRI